MKGYWLGTAIFVCVGARVCVYAARSRPCRAGPAARHPLGRPLTRLLPCIQPEHQRILEYLRNTQAALHPQLLCARAVLSISRLSLLLLHRYLPLHRISPPLLHPHHPPLHPLVRHRLLHRACVTTPIEVVQARWQTSGAAGKTARGGIAGIVKEMWRQGGARAFTRGLGIRIAYAVSWARPLLPPDC